MESTNKVVLALSGGLDSTILTYQLCNQFGNENVHAITFSYNQRHDIEMEQAKKTTSKLGIYHKIIDISFLGDITKKVSSMVKGDVATPNSAENNMPSSYVPFRNAIFTTLISSYAESNNINNIALGLNVDQPDDPDYKYRYWDITPDFYQSMQALLDLNTSYSLKLIAPFVLMDKKAELELGLELGVPFEDTFTCYDPKLVGEEIRYESEPMGGKNPVKYLHYMPCGVCASCAERRQAFKKVGIDDPIVQHGVWVRA
jgi:7-cyano-7-deazaguanine synthase